jgi:glucose/arabinose dehydrogenase
MRRTTAILTLCLCAVAGCRGGGAQEPYDGLIARAQPRAAAAAVSTPQAPEAEPIASAVDVPWTIALLSDGARPAARKRGKGLALDVNPAVAATIAEEAHLNVAVEPTPTDDKPATPKACSGVVKTRS